MPLSGYDISFTYLFYLCPSLCPSLGINKINILEYGLVRKGYGYAVNDAVLTLTKNTASPNA